jgi:tetratricopeptide (TPR) repeat protein
MSDRHSLDAHPLLREFFAKRLQAHAAASWKEAHSRLFDHLRTEVPFWPEGLEGLQPLYQAVAHGCRAERYQEACDEIYFSRICRGSDTQYGFYSEKMLGVISANLGALGCFFVVPWTLPATQLAEHDRVWVVAEAARYLRATGRLTEARELMSQTASFYEERKLWKQAARGAHNLTDVLLILGEIALAVRESEHSLRLADLSDDDFSKEICRTSYACALHQSGGEEARRNFEEAEARHKELFPDYPLLYGLQGFRFCELLLQQDERAAWQQVVQADSSRSHMKATTASYHEVEARALQTLGWVAGNLGILDEAISNLTLGRVALYRASLEKSSLATCHSALESAVVGFRQAGKQEYVVQGLLTRAWLQLLENEPKKATVYLDEALQIAERGPMRLHLADIYLHRVRLFFRADPYPWNTNPDGTPRGPRDDLAAARKLITDRGYGRRIPELEDAERAIPGG